MKKALLAFFQLQIATLAERSHDHQKPKHLIDFLATIFIDSIETETFSALHIDDHFTLLDIQ